MEVSYDVDRDHMLEEIRVAAARVVAATRFDVLRIGGYAVVAALAVIWLQLKDHPTISVSEAVAIILIALGVLIFVVTKLSERQRWRAIGDAMESQAGRYSVSIGATGVTGRAGQSSATIDWSRIQAVSITEDYVRIDQSGFATLLIPKDAFASEADLQSFVDRISAEIGKAGTG